MLVWQLQSPPSLILLPSPSPASPPKSSLSGCSSFLLQDENMASLPILSTFCYYAILGLAFVYLYMCTFFLAALTFDQKRIEAGRWVEPMIWFWEVDAGTPSAAGSNLTILIKSAFPLTSPFQPGSKSGNEWIIPFHNADRSGQVCPTSSQASENFSPVGQPGLLSSKYCCL